MSRIKRTVATAIYKLGYEVKRKGRIFDNVQDENEYADLIRLVRDHTMAPPQRLISLSEQVEYCDQNGIQGAYVECGVWKGGSIATMAWSHLRSNVSRRNLHLFDAFSDICEPDENVDGDRAIQEVKQWATKPGSSGKLRALDGFYNSFGGPGTIEINRELLERRIGYPSDKIFYHKGWFQDTLPADRDSVGPIAILRLDGDWYASTKVCLENLYDQVVPGGFVVIDDYGAYDGCRKAVDEFYQQKKLSVFSPPCGCGVSLLDQSVTAEGHSRVLARFDCEDFGLNSLSSMATGKMWVIESLTGHFPNMKSQPRVV